MYSRKSVDHGHSNVQSLEFSCFKKKNGEATVQVIKTDRGQNSFIFPKTSNGYITIFVISHLLHPGKSKKPKKAPLKTFQDFAIDNVPRNFYNFQHESTLEQLWSHIKEKATSFQAIQDLLENYPITQFVFNCYGRRMIKNYIQENPNLDLLGNQEQILSDYNVQIRGPLLDILANSLRIDVSIFYSDESDFEPSVIEKLGESDSSWKLWIYDTTHKYKCQLSEEDQPKLTSIHSSNQIPYYQASNKNSKQKETSILDTTEEGQSMQRSQLESRSANKDNFMKCPKCGSKGKFCGCEQRKKGATPRSSNQNKSIFQSLAFHQIGAKKAREEANSKQCWCGRVFCICKKQKP